MIGRNNIRSLRQLATLAYTSLTLLLAGVGVIAGLALVVVSVLGVVAGQLIWSIAWAAMAAARGRLADLLSGKARPEAETYVQVRGLPDSPPVE
jgi:hypothetical protein